MEFITFTILSVIVVVLILRFTLSSREYNPISNIRVIIILAVLETFCMILGKYGANFALPWWIYFPVPLLLTVLFPPLFFRMRKKETVKYLVLISVSTPLIHIIFSLFGWKNYMPFISIPSIMELTG